MCNIHEVFSAKRKCKTFLILAGHTSSCRWQKIPDGHLFCYIILTWGAPHGLVHSWVLRRSFNEVSHSSSQALEEDCHHNVPSFSHSITPHLLPVFLLIKERSYSSERGMASPEPWTRTSLSFDFSLPLSFAIWLCRALYSLQSGAKY